MYLLFAINKL